MRLAICGAALWLHAGSASAEPYLALRTGLSCTSCHVNRTGGGGRTAYGAGYGSQSLPWRVIRGVDSLFDGTITERVRLGSDLRGAYVGNLQDPGPFVGEFRVSEANLYLTLDLLPDRLVLYADERVAPGGAVNREAFALLRAGSGGFYVKAGKFYLPFGLRLQDDEALTRRFTGFSFNSQDVGVEIGAEAKGWSSALAVTNGTGGGAETNNGKQVTWTGSYLHPVWRGGLSASHNDLPGPASRKVGGGFVGASTGPVVVLAECDLIRDDDGVSPEVRSAVGHVEVDWMPTQGINLRAWVGRYDPDREVDGNRQDQAGIGIDWTPLPGIQLRGYYRARKGPSDLAGSGDDQAVAELHVFF
jgi:hypothetical protein